MYSTYILIYIYGRSNLPSAAQLVSEERLQVILDLDSRFRYSIAISPNIYIQV